MKKRPDIAIVRQHLQRIDGVSRTWFEWSLDYDDDGSPLRVKTLVVEVDFDTDPNSTGFRESVLDAIADTAKGVLSDETTMIVSYLKIVPKGLL
ncbi:hypothetical protein [Taklimakanibacter deserti]|uniref:hypothetical protein n=1 Tax=Taklimakanibacter deserti TaxID=2267839 RepID=UPI000E64F390